MMRQNKLRELRMKKDVTQRAVAYAIHRASSSYAHYEKSERKPDPETWELLAKYFGVSVAYIRGEE